jgi:predicted nucleic acid-binding protein
MDLVLDSSVIVAALRKEESKHVECKRMLERVKSGEILALEPYTVLVEVVAAIRRRTDSRKLAERVKRDLLHILDFWEFTSFRAEKACDLANKTAVRGMDAIIIQIAEEFDAPLVSLDKEMMEKAKSLIKIKEVW